MHARGLPGCSAQPRPSRLPVGMHMHTQSRQGMYSPGFTRDWFRLASGTSQFGILIGLVLKYCDSIIKNLSLSTAIVTTSVLDSYFFAGPMNLSIVSAGAIVLVSILNYTSSD